MSIGQWKSLPILCGPPISEYKWKLTIYIFMVDHRNTSLPESQPTEYPASKPCLMCISRWYARERYYALLWNARFLLYQYISFELCNIFIIGQEKFIGCAFHANYSQRMTLRFAFICELLMVHIHWASHARDPWSHARFHSFAGNPVVYTFVHSIFHHIVIVSDKNYHNKVKKYCIHLYTTLLEVNVKPCMKSLISCVRCSVYVHQYCISIPPLILTIF